MRQASKAFQVAVGIVAMLLVVLTSVRPPSADAFEVTAVMAGTVNDAGFYLQGHQTLEQLKKSYGAKTGIAELVKISDAERIVRRYANAGSNLIIGHGGAFRETMLKVAPDFPKVSFIVITGGPIKGMPKNVWNVQSYYHEAYYLAGAAAALATKSNKIGYVGGIDFPVYVSAAKGYELGAKAVNPKAEVMVTFLGSFDDALKGREATKSQVEAGADIVAHNLDLGVFGVVEALKGTNAKMIGMGLDQSSLAPGQVLTTVLIDYVRAYVTIAEKVMKGELGGDLTNSLKAGYVKLAPIGLAPADVARVNQLTEQIKSGRLEVPLIYKR